MPPQEVIRHWSTPAEILDGVDAVIFDNDGTLVNTMPTHLRGWQHAVAAYGLEFPPRQFYALAGMSLREIVARLAAEQGKPVPPAADVVARKHAFHHADGGRLSDVAPIGPTMAVLAEARRRGLRVAVASGGERAEVVDSLVGAGVVPDAGAGLDGAFGALVTSEDVTHGKPDPETFLLAAKRLNVAPERCVGLEDGELGLQALAAAGMRPVDVRLHADYPLDAELKKFILANVAEK